MKLQKDSFSCGVFAIINAAKCLGIDLKRRDITKYSNTTRKNGTTEKGLLSALKANGLHGEDLLLDKKKIAFEVLDEILSNKLGKPVILAVDNDNHWITIIGKLGNKYIMFDSDCSKYNKEENGVHILSVAELEQQWKNKKGKYYCIIVDQKN